MRMKLTGRFLQIFLATAIISGQSSGQIFTPYEPQPQNQPKATPQKQIENAEKSQPKAAVPTKTQTIPSRMPNRTEPPARLIPDSVKSQDQKSYEAESQKKLDDFVARVKRLEERLELLPQDQKSKYRPSLRTARGNRSVVRTKVKQLKYVQPTDWFILKAGIEEAFKNLSDSVVYLENLLPTSPTEASKESKSKSESTPQ